VILNTRDNHFQEVVTNLSVSCDLHVFWLCLHRGLLSKMLEGCDFSAQRHTS